MYQVVSNVPLPKKELLNRPGRVKYPFSQMKPGQSFLVPTEEAERVLNALRIYRRRSGEDFVWKRAEDGMRIWKMEGKYTPMPKPGTKKAAKRK